MSYLSKQFRQWAEQTAAQGGDPWGIVPPDVFAEMIRLRYCEPFTDEWSEAAFTGDAAEATSSILAASLLRLDWEVHIARFGGEFVTLGEDEGELDFDEGDD